MNASPLLARLHAAADPDAILVRSGDAAWSSAQLLAAAARLADRLRDASVRVLASQYDNGIDWLIADLAAQWVGAVHVPLPMFFSPSQVAHAIAAAGVDHWLGTQPPAGDPHLDWQGDGDLWRHPQPHRVERPAGCRLITFTSGSTGQPKGVALDHATLFNLADSLVAATAPFAARAHLCALPLATLLEQVAGYYAALLSGASLAVPALAELGYREAGALDVERFLGALARYQPESLILVPQLLLALVSAGERGARLPSSLRLIAVGGAPVGATLLARTAALGLPVYEGYGLSECASVVCLNLPGACRSGSVGRPLPHVRLDLADDGELLVKGSAMLGYLGEPAPATDVVATGDLARIDDDGFVHIIGRKRNIFISAYGRNLSPEWLEAELTQTSAIAQAVVFGEARPYNVAVLVARQPEVGAAELQAAVRAVNAALPDYARIRDWVRADAPFDAANGLATGNGRARREAVIAHYRQRIDACYRAGNDLDLDLDPGIQPPFNHEATP